MGEFPDPAIHGSEVPLSTSTSTAAAPSNPVEPVESDPAPTSSEDVVTTSVESSLAPVTMRAISSSVFTSRAGSTSLAGSTTSRSEQVPATTSEQVSSASTMQTATTTTNTMTSSSQIIQTSSQSSVVFSSSALALSASQKRISTVHTPTLGSTTSLGSTKSLPATSTRPIITPMPTIAPGPTTELITGNSHLSFGAIVAIVTVVFVVLGIACTCVVLGPKRTLRKVGIGRSPEERTYEEWEDGETQEEGEAEEKRPESLSANSDWWRAPSGALGSRVSTVSVAGPGMAGVGAGRTAQRPPGARVNVDERRAVRSGWFATSMVRGASLLSLGSMARPAEPSVSEMPRNRGGQGSAGRRFQELYRRERGMGVSEMGERQRSGRVSVPGVRRPSRLGAVPAILVHDATLPSLSSVSNVTHGSGGRGYDADGEGEQRVY